MPSFFLHAKLNRQSMCIPACFTNNTVTFHCIVTSYKVLDNASQHVADMRLAVCRRAVLRKIRSSACLRGFSIDFLNVFSVFHLFSMRSSLARAFFFDIYSLHHDLPFNNWIVDRPQFTSFWTQKNLIPEKDEVVLALPPLNSVHHKPISNHMGRLCHQQHLCLRNHYSRVPI